MYRFVPADTDALANKRKQTLPKACDSCRKRKKRCDHNDGGIMPKRTKQSLSGAQSTGALIVEPSRAGDNIAPQEPPSATPDLTHSTVATAGQDEEASPSAGHVLFPQQQSLQPTSAAACISSGSTSEPPQPAPQRAFHRVEALNSRFIGDLSPESVFQAATSPEVTRDSPSNHSVGVGVWLAKKRLNSRTLPRPSAQTLATGSTPSSLMQKVVLPVLEEEIARAVPTPARCEALVRIYFDKVQPLLPVIDETGFRDGDVANPSTRLLVLGMCLAASKNAAAEEWLVLPGSDSPLGCMEFGNRIMAAMRLAVDMSLVTDKIVLIQVLTLMSHFMDGPDSADVASLLCGRAVVHGQTVGIHLSRQYIGHDGRYAGTLLCCLWAVDRMNAAFHGRPVLIHERDLGMDLVACIDQQQPPFRLLLSVVKVLDEVIGLYRPQTATGPALEVDFPSFEELVDHCGGSKISPVFVATIETLYHAVAILSCRTRNPEKPSRSSASYMRQALSSSLISSSITRDLRHQDQVILFPFVPYSVSLSLSVAYREMRHNKITLQRARARGVFQKNCDVLMELGDVFWSASMMAEMGLSTLKELDRVFHAVAGNGSGPVSRRQSPGAGHTADAHNVDQATKTASTNIQPQHNFTFPLLDFDLSMFDAVSDVDLFGMFDPSFDLHGIDACLEGNLDLSFPTMM